MALLPQESKQQVLPLQGEEHGPCSLKAHVSLGFFLSFAIFLSGGQKLLGNFFLKRKFLLRISWAGGLGMGVRWGWLLLLSSSKDLHCLSVR